jgi:hypothetical protein
MSRRSAQIGLTDVARNADADQHPLKSAETRIANQFTHSSHRGTQKRQTQIVAPTLKTRRSISYLHLGGNTHGFIV